MGKDLLDLYEDVNRVVPIRDRRWVIEHISTLTADEIGRIRDLGVVVATHTNRYLYKEGEVLRSRVGPATEDTIVPLQSLKEAGVHVALATDNVPTSLFMPLWQAVARTDRYSGRVVAPSKSSRARTRYARRRSRARTSPSRRTKRARSRPGSSRTSSCSPTTR